LKPKYEADFIVRWDPKNGVGKWGKGKKSTGVGSVQSYLWDEKKGEVEVSLVGGGLTDEDVKKFANPKLYPMVWEVEYDSMTPNGSLRFPEFVRVRDDKPLKECTFSQIPEKFLAQLNRDT
jgi:ATP-dependent DNA ligase